MSRKLRVRTLLIVGVSKPVSDSDLLTLGHDYSDVVLKHINFRGGCISEARLKKIKEAREKGVAVAVVVSREREEGEVHTVEGGHVHCSIHHIYRVAVVRAFTS